MDSLTFFVAWGMVFWGFYLLKKWWEDKQDKSFPWIPVGLFTMATIIFFALASM